MKKKIIRVSSNNFRLGVDAVRGGVTRERKNTNLILEFVKPVGVSIFKNV